MFVAIISFILVFTIFVVSHELGHFLVGKALGVRVLEFAVGMGPKIAGVIRNGTLYSVRLLPVGAFVRFAGLDSRDDDKSGVQPDDPQSFRNRSVLERVMIVVAGPLANLLMAVVIFTLGFAWAGVPGVSIDRVMPGSPAEMAGLLPGDEVLAIEGQNITAIERVRDIVGRSVGRPLAFKLVRDGQTLVLKVVPERDQETDGGIVGVILKESWRRQGLLPTIRAGGHHTLYLTQEFAEALVEMITGRSRAEVAGPIGIARIVGQSAKVGLLNLLFLVGVLNVNLGLINLLPIPVLDGGWVAMLLIEGVRRRPFEEEQELFLRLVGTVIILLLVLYATYNDILRLEGRGI